MRYYKLAMNLLGWLILTGQISLFVTNVLENATLFKGPWPQFSTMTDNFLHEFKTIEVISIPLDRKNGFILATLQEQFLVNSSRPDSNYTKNSLLF